jgi:hypothetical protein
MRSIEAGRAGTLADGWCIRHAGRWRRLLAQRRQAARLVFTVPAPPEADKIDLPADATAAPAGFSIHADRLGWARFTAHDGLT